MTTRSRCQRVTSDLASYARDGPALNIFARVIDDLRSYYLQFITLNQHLNVDTIVLNILVARVRECATRRFLLREYWRLRLGES
jgi:hypothetical protein